MRMEDFTKAFPKRVLIEPYLQIINAAYAAHPGGDGMPQCVVEDYESYQMAVKAANAIRKHSREKKLNLKVSVPENQKSITVYRGKPVQRKEKKEKSKNAAAEPQLTAA